MEARQEPECPPATEPVLDLPPLISALCDPKFHHVDSSSIRLIQTPTNYVVLNGESAFKIKKAIRTSWLDYSKLDDRRFFSCEELRLNSHWAQEIYEEVLAAIQLKPISSSSTEPPSFELRHASPAKTLQDDLAELKEGETLVDYVIKMKQFDTRQQLDCLCDSKKLSQKHIEQLAELVANKHLALGSEKWKRPAQVTPEYIRSLIMENFETIQSILEQYEQKHASEETSEKSKIRIMRQQLRHIQMWTIAELHAKSELIHDRWDQGFLRECHADLHLGNIVIFHDNVLPFDSLEFNASYRIIDVINDVAFTCMDLEKRGRADLSNLLLNRYLELTGDYASMRLWRLYKCYRALIRAKVNVLKTSETEPDDGGYIALAFQYLQYRRPLRLFLTHGLSGSGKSLGSMVLVRCFNAIRLRSDVIRKRLYPHTETRYSEEATKHTYEYMLTVAEQILVEAHLNVVVDATFLKRWQRKLFIEHDYSSETVPITILHFEAPVQLLESRLNERKDDESEANVQILHEQMKSDEALTEEEQALCVNFHSDQDSADKLQKEVSIAKEIVAKCFNPSPRQETNKQPTSVQ